MGVAVLPMYIVLQGHWLYNVRFFLFGARLSADFFYELKLFSAWLYLVLTVPDMFLYLCNTSYYYVMYLLLCSIEKRMIPEPRNENGTTFGCVRSFCCRYNKYTYYYFLNSENISELCKETLSTRYPSIGLYDNECSWTFVPRSHIVTSPSLTLHKMQT